WTGSCQVAFPRSLAPFLQATPSYREPHADSKSAGRPEFAFLNPIPKLHMSAARTKPRCTSNCFPRRSTPSHAEERMPRREAHYHHERVRSAYGGTRKSKMARKSYVSTARMRC